MKVYQVSKLVHGEGEAEGVSMLVVVVDVLLIALPNGVSHQLLFRWAVLFAMHLNTYDR